MIICVQPILDYLEAENISRRTLSRRLGKGDTYVNFFILASRGRVRDKKNTEQPATALIIGRIVDYPPDVKKKVIDAYVAAGERRRVKKKVKGVYVERVVLTKHETAEARRRLSNARALKRCAAIHYPTPHPQPPRFA